MPHLALARAHEALLGDVGVEVRVDALHARRRRDHRLARDALLLRAVLAELLAHRREGRVVELAVVDDLGALARVESPPLQHVGLDLLPQPARVEAVGERKEFLHPLLLAAAQGLLRRLGHVLGVDGVVHERDERLDLVGRRVLGRQAALLHAAPRVLLALGPLHVLLVEELARPQHLLGRRPQHSDVGLAVELVLQHREHAHARLTQGLGRRRRSRQWSRRSHRWSRRRGPRRGRRGLRRRTRRRCRRSRRRCRGSWRSSRRWTPRSRRSRRRRRGTRPGRQGMRRRSLGAATLGVVGGSAPDIMGPVGHAQTAIGTPIWPGGVTMYCAGQRSTTASGACHISTTHGVVGLLWNQIQTGSQRTLAAACCAAR